MGNFCFGTSDNDCRKDYEKIDKIWFHSPKNERSIVWTVLSFITRVTVSILVKFWIVKLNSLVVHNVQQFWSLLENRPCNRGLITVCNHYSTMDDPFILCVKKWKHVLSAKYLRWIPTAHNICFTKTSHCLFFSLGNCVPVIRGDGVYQKGIDFLLEKLNHGETVHVFPEGKVNSKHERMRLKWGVGRLVAESDITPIVLPLFHLGFDDVLPNKKPYRLHTGKNVTILVGDPIDYTEDLIRLRNLNKTLTEQRKYITDDIQARLFHLRATTEKLHQDRLTSSNHHGR